MDLNRYWRAQHNDTNIEVQWTGFRFEGGWTFEMAIPFKSLRYAGSGPQVWGINFRRIVKWKNEVSFLTSVPAAYGVGGIFRASVAATLVGLVGRVSAGYKLFPLRRVHLIAFDTTEQTASIVRKEEIRT